MYITNSEVLSMIDELINLTMFEEQNSNSFKVKAYTNAKYSLAEIREPIAELSKLELNKINGIGKSTADKVYEFTHSGEVEKINQLRNKYPPGLTSLKNLSGVGIKTALKINQIIKLNTIEDLIHVDSKQIDGVSKETIQKITEIIEKLGYKQNKTITIAHSADILNRYTEKLKTNQNIINALPSGEFVRLIEIQSDLQILVLTKNIEQTIEEVQNNIYDNIQIIENNIISLITKKENASLKIKFTEPESWEYETIKSTTSKEFYEELKRLSQKKNASLQTLSKKVVDISSYTDFRNSNYGKKIFSELNIQYVCNPLRDNLSALELAANNSLPDLPQVDDIRGDLHYHSDRSGDGHSTLLEMTIAAINDGLEYIAFTEHGENLAINGSTEEQLTEHSKKIEQLNNDYDINILYGCELNIGATGKLDYDKDFRSTFEYTVASVHSDYDLSITQQTNRLVKAISDPSVYSIGHLSGRYIGKRLGIEFETDIVLEALAEFDVALEINSSLQRLDATTEILRKAKDKKIKFVINTDSHHVSELSRRKYGVMAAQKTLIDKKQIINTWPKEKFFSWLETKSS